MHEQAQPHSSGARLFPRVFVRLSGKRRLRLIHVCGKAILLGKLALKQGARRPSSASVFQLRWR